MGETKIELTDATWSPVTDCASDFACWERLNEPEHWKKPRRIFVGGDVFHEAVPYDFHLRLWDTFAKCPQHTFVLVTKQARRMAAVTREIGGYDPDGQIPLSAEYRDFAENVWLGASCTNQPYTDARLPWLFKCPAAVRLVSLVPLLGEIDLSSWLPTQGVCEACWQEAQRRQQDCPLQSVTDHYYEVMAERQKTHAPCTRRLDQVIVGGETGPGARPMKPDWVRSIRDSCVEAGVPLFFKSHGDWLHETQVADSGPQYEAVKAILLRRDERNIHFWPDGEMSYRVGKKCAGRLLDGREWDQFPERSVTDDN